jgi:CRISPR/Cas system CMR subunit Cmr4 (Cas7 group RAMP superfamily)
MRAKEKVWLWLVTSKLLLDRITSDIESIVHIRDWITRTLCTPAERTRIDASQRHSAPAERELLHELRHDREVSPDLVASLDSSVSWTASDTLLISRRSHTHRRLHVRLGWRF